jgi:hypothetical protein
MIFFSPIVYFFSVLIGGLNYKFFNHNFSVKVFLFYLIFTDVIEIALSTLAYFKMNNHSMVNIYLLGTFLLIANIILPQRFKLFLAFFISLILLALILIVVKFNFLIVNIPFLILVSTLVLVICGYFVIKESNDDTTSITKNPLFWLNSGLLIYYFSMLGMLVLFNIITSPNHKLITSYFNYFNHLMILFSNSLYIKGFLCCKTMKY